MPASDASDLVLKLALMIEPRMALAIAWYLHTPIKELGGISAKQLVDQGKAAWVAAFLKSIYRGDRD
jgi:hypothetical protein